MVCHFYRSGACRSCAQIETPVALQLDEKNRQLAQLLAPFDARTWLSPVASAPVAFRNKAKMVALGAAHQPCLGIVSPEGEPVSLATCPLYPDDMQQLLRRLERFVQQAGVPPYRVDKRKGELKFVLLTRSQWRGEFMLRFVLRSQSAIERIQRYLPELIAEWPQIKVVSVNIQPVHMAILEGEEEIFLTGQTLLEERINDVTLYIRARSFFQTNPEVAAALYQTARTWCRELQPASIWDLFCGVGGFGLHCATPDTQLTGIEIEPEAILCAQRSAQAMGLSRVQFSALDSALFASETEQQPPDLVIVNPPRRGIGEALCQQLEALSPAVLIYSSCNAQTLARDLSHLPGYRLDRVQLFDMFPHTSHYEVLTLLTRH